MSSPTINIVPPPGASISQIRPHPPFDSATYPSVHPGFLSALSVRFPVYVDEQHCSPTEEIDKDDPISWHWVAYVTEQDASTDGHRRVPAGTIRLIPASPLPIHHDDSEESREAEREVAEEHAEKALGPKHGKTEMWDGKEAFVKLGRLATLQEYRKLGIGRVLVDTAVEWLEENHVKVVGGVTSQEDDVYVKRIQTVGKWNGLVLVHAQKAIEPFWVGCGFVRDGGMGEWWEEGIEHVAMWRRVTVR